IVQDLQLDEVKRLRGVRTEHFKEDKINRSEVHKYYQKILDPSWTEETKVVVIEYETNDTEATIEQKTQKEMVKTKMEENQVKSVGWRAWVGDIVGHCEEFNEIYIYYKPRLATPKSETHKKWMIDVILEESRSVCKKVHSVSNRVTKEENPEFIQDAVNQVFKKYLDHNQARPGFIFLAQVDQLMLQGSTDQAYEDLLEKME
ncbi:MAG: hypothetical protein SFT93_05355, partial [Rickettsiaceae bacterium]|nr:hypothetical protein [Rickettsiaceae bacterium]